MRDHSKAKGREGSTPGRATCTRKEGETARRIKAVYNSPHLYSRALKLNLSTCINSAARFAKVFDRRLSKAELYLAVVMSDYRESARAAFQTRVETNLEDARKERANPRPRETPAKVKTPARKTTVAAGALTIVAPLPGLNAENVFFTNLRDDSLAAVGFPEGSRILFRRASSVAPGSLASINAGKRRGFVVGFVYDYGAEGITITNCDGDVEHFAPGKATVTGEAIPYAAPPE